MPFFPDFKKTLPSRPMQGFAFLNLDIRHHPDLEVIAQRLNGISLKDVELNVQTDQVRFFISPFLSSGVSQRIVLCGQVPLSAVTDKGSRRVVG